MTNPINSPDFYFPSSMADPSEYFASRSDLNTRVRELKKTLKVHRQTRKRLKLAVSQRGCQQDAFSQLIRTRNEIGAIKTHVTALKRQKEEELFKYMTKLNGVISDLQGLPPPVPKAPVHAPGAINTLASKGKTQHLDKATPPHDAGSPLGGKASCAPEETVCSTPHRVSDATMSVSESQPNFGATVEELMPLAVFFVLNHHKKSGSLEFIPLTTFCRQFEVWGKEQPGWKTASRVVCLTCCEKALKDNRFTITRNTQIISRDGERTIGDVINGIVRVPPKYSK